MQCLLAFSVTRNTGKIISTERRVGSMHCLHGIRTISMLWVMYGHCYYFAIGFIGECVQQSVDASDFGKRFALSIN